MKFPKFVQRFFSFLVTSAQPAASKAPVAEPVAEPVAVKVPPIDKKGKLTKLLSASKYKFRTLETLATKIASSPSETIALLVEIGARAAGGNDKKWGLVARVGQAPRARSFRRSY